MTSRTGTNAIYEFVKSANSDTAYTVNGRNQLTTAGTRTLTYDGRGNLASDGTTSWSYDADNRLTGASNGSSLAYDAIDRLRETTIAGTVTRYAYDGPNLIGEYNSSNGLLRRYVHGPGVDEPLVSYAGVGTARPSWLAADPGGSIVAVTDALGAATVQTYDEYGIMASPQPGLFKYTGQVYLAGLDLYHYKARAYSPTLGRFLQTDPTLYDDGPNLYAYVGNDPMNKRDPTGTYGRGSGFTDDDWRKFDLAQQRAAHDMERRAEKMEQRADKLDARGRDGGAQLRADAGNLRGGAAALRSNGSDGRMANVVDQATYQSLGGSKDGAAFVRSNGPIMTVNRDNAAAWKSGSQMTRWTVGHESLHTAGLNDQKGPNGRVAYKFGTDPQRDAFRAVRGTPLEHINPDSLMDMVY